MRIVAAVALMAIAGPAIAPAAAQTHDPYPWCAEYSFRAATNCYFATHEQCRAALSGNGGYCRRNLFYTGRLSDGPSRRYRKRERN